MAMQTYWLWFDFFFFLYFWFLTDKVTADAALDPSGLVAIAICHGFALFVAVAIGANISGGHVNPAVTFGLALGGQITILTGIFYWIAQLLGSIVASFLLKVVTGGLVCFKIYSTFIFLVALFLLKQCTILLIRVIFPFIVKSPDPIRIPSLSEQCLGESHTKNGRCLHIDRTRI